MNPSSSTLITSPSSSLLPSPFIPLRLPSISKRRRFRVSFPSCSSASSPAPAPVQKDLNGIELVVDKLSPPLRLATSAIVVAGAVAAGYALGSRFGGSRNAALGGAVALGVAGGATAYALNAVAPQVAAVNLHNYVAGLDHPSMLKKEDIDGIANRYGVNKQDEAFKAEICDIYSQFVSSVLPPGGEELNGDEADRIISFKSLWELMTQMQLLCIWRLGGNFSGKSLKLGIMKLILSSAGPGISEVDICVKSCFWRSIIFPSTLEACFQGH